MRKSICIGLAAVTNLAASWSVHGADAKAILIDTFDTPVYATAAPGERRLLFVVEQRGTIRVIDNDATANRPFLDLTSIVQFDGSERGLLSMAFPHDYQASRLFYVAFNNSAGDVEIDEFRRSGTNHKIANLGTRRKVLTIRHRQAGNHNGGQLQFGPDGFLYISVGDGGELTPRGWPAPDPEQLLGKILRINPEKAGNRPYTIPPSNPYVGMANHRKEIYAYGFRNPWRFVFEDNKIIIADVGQNAFEEINFLTLSAAKGANFGWPDWEGKHPFDSPNVPPGADPPTFPMLQYAHTQGRCAVIGGYVSHDPAIPALADRYLYGDLCNGVIRSMVPHVGSQKATDLRNVGITATNLSSFGRGPDGRLYITQTSGQLSRIEPP